MELVVPVMLPLTCYPDDRPPP